MRAPRVTFSAPGKLILMGEHAVVYGHPALVAAVDRRLTARLSSAAGAPGTVEIRSSRLPAPVTSTWAELAAYARAARERWERYAEAPSPETFARVRGADPAHLARVALGEAALVFAQGGGLAEGPPAVLEIESRIPLGSGFGSSAALAVAVTAAALAFHGAAAESATVEGLALEAERRQHGLPSGVDSATVLHGGIVWAERWGDGRLAVEPLPEQAARSPHLERFRILDTGTPQESTGAVVAAVRQRLGEEPERIRTALDILGTLVRGLRAELLAASPDSELMIASLRQAEARLEELGVVPEPVRRLVRRVEAEGGAAKISGAGALSSPAGGLGAGSLLVYHPEPERIRRWPFLAGLEPLPLALGAEGLRREEEQAQP